jgi:hypothetical protein
MLLVIDFRSNSIHGSIERESMTAVAEGASILTSLSMGKRAPQPQGNHCRSFGLTEYIIIVIHPERRSKSRFIFILQGFGLCGRD